MLLSSVKDDSGPKALQSSQHLGLALILPGYPFDTHTKGDKAFFILLDASWIEMHQTDILERLLSEC